MDFEQDIDNLISTICSISNEKGTHAHNVGIIKAVVNKWLEFVLSEKGVCSQSLGKSVIVRIIANYEEYFANIDDLRNQILVRHSLKKKSNDKTVGENVQNYIY